MHKFVQAQRNGRLSTYSDINIGKQKKGAF